MNNGSSLESTVAALQQEVSKLRTQVGTETASNELRRALSLAAVTGLLTTPVVQSDLLPMVVASAAEIIGAAAGALFLIDERDQCLTFEVAFGEKADTIKHFRIPLGQGIAGLVAVTGQPMAISNAQDDSRHAADIAQAAGYLPKNILCVPLISNDEVIGVLELLDRVDGASFRPQDIDVLGLFADIAAVAIQQNRTRSTISRLILDAIQNAGGSTTPNAVITSFLDELESDPAHQMGKAMASLVHTIAWRGERERQACYKVLQAFAEL